MITEETIQKITYRYRKNGNGYISKIYSVTEEQKYYKEAAKILSKRFNKFISQDEIYEILSKRGHIFTMVIRKNMKAFYETKTGNVAISHFLNRMTEMLLHELVHKLSFERKNNTFFQMSPVFIEAGTELVKAKALSDSFGKEYIFNKVWAKFPQKINDYFLEVCLVNQINEALGNEYLEKSILQGQDFFKPALIEKYGISTYVFLKENLQDLSREEKIYWSKKEKFSSSEKEEFEEKLKEKIFVIENAILEAEFNQRLNEVKSLEEAIRFLNELKKFGLNRVRIQQNDKNIQFLDPGFFDYFSNYKKILEDKFGKIDLQYDEKEWQNIYERKEFIDEVSEEEKEQVLNSSVIFRDSLKETGKFFKFINSIFRRKKLLKDESSIKDSNENNNNNIFVIKDTSCLDNVSYKKIPSNKQDNKER